MTTIRALAQMGNRKKRFLLYIWLGTLTIFFIVVATFDLANYRPISGDDGWILSASYKLATEGVFGSDMYNGFFQADRYYFIALPGQHIMQALSMRLFGTGVSQARWVSVLSGVVLLWAVSILAYRWYGAAVGALTSLLLLFWQPALVGEGSVPLVTLSRSLRYDLPAVAWIWLTILFVDLWLRQPTVVRSFFTGLTSAAATLTQFFGILAPMIALLSVLTSRRRQNLTVRVIASWLVGFFSLISPYLLFVTAHWQQAVGQTAYLKGERFGFVSGTLRNLWHEPRRYQYFLGQIDIAPGPWILLLGVGPGLVYLVLRLRYDGHHGDRVLALAFATTFVLLALLDQTKAPIYALPLLPPLSITFALVTIHVLSWSFERREIARRAVGFSLLVLVGLTILHGIHFYYRDRRDALRASDYEALGRAIDSAMQPGSTATGSERWWWPLRKHNYFSLNNLSLQWNIRRDRRTKAVSFESLARKNGIQYVIVDPLVRASMKQRSQLLQLQFSAYLKDCGTLHEVWADTTYGEIRLYVVKSACR